MRIWNQDLTDEELNLVEKEVKSLKREDIDPDLVECFDESHELKVNGIRFNKAHNEKQEIVYFQQASLWCENCRALLFVEIKDIFDYPSNLRECDENKIKTYAFKADDGLLDDYVGYNPVLKVMNIEKDENPIKLIFDKDRKLKVI